MKFAILVLFAQALFGQTAILRGLVTDETGAVVPGAKVTLAGGGSAKSTAADSTGAYTFAGVQPGDYMVQASAPDLAQPQPVRVALKAGTQSVNLTLRVASMAEKVTVEESGAPAVSTESSNNASAVVLRGSDLDA